eukprot:TRINITY_DN10937_c0_g1_i2.p1 TRINITY_DN10937_c0_g1~~TRINITY_DN10937_c0_g1_i2.p1  ORF type:complete len:115 (-),score=7.43 TRINITY_DN10937_c0_g1_i2:448-792(-)
MGCPYGKRGMRAGTQGGGYNGGEAAAPPAATCSKGSRASCKAGGQAGVAWSIEGRVSEDRSEGYKTYRMTTSRLSTILKKALEKAGVTGASQYATRSIKAGAITQDAASDSWLV